MYQHRSNSHIKILVYLYQYFVFSQRSGWRAMAFCLYYLKLEKIINGWSYKEMFKNNLEFVMISFLFCSCKFFNILGHILFRPTDPFCHTFLSSMCLITHINKISFYKRKNLNPSRPFIGLVLKRNFSWTRSIRNCSAKSWSHWRCIRMWTLLN